MLQSSKRYEKGVEDYLDWAFATKAIGDQISCPCKLCYHRFWHRRDKVFNHLIANGIQPGTEALNTEMNTEGIPDDMDHLIYDTHRDFVERFTHNNEEVGNEPNAEAKKFYKLIEDGKEELYPGCKTFSKLSFLIRLFLLKCIHGLTNNAFSEILDLIRELLPEAKLPKSFNEANKLVKDLGLHYDKIDACRNDCMLYWKDHEADTFCHVCQAPRWKESENQGGNQVTNTSHKVPAKVIWYFPLKPRLQRIYMCSETAELMRWHDEKRDKDELLRHPADGQAWKEFDRLYPNFSREARNVRLGLASDGFNPFRTMSTQHSTWPVVLINYNLPPWLSMKSEFLMLSTLIPGPTSPGNEIDVFLQPLVEELLDLWEYGSDTYDASKNQTFKMHVALRSTTSDFPGYAMLSGWSTKGKFACPYCHYETGYRSLCKSCYLANRRFLDANHPWRYDVKSFDGEKEERTAPSRLTGTEILSLSQNWENKFGKLLPKQNNKDCPWRKLSIFFRLPYWKDNMCRHHLDVMHIEKNICDSVLGTLLDIPGKTKDNHKARLDLQKMGIRKELHPVESDDDRYVFLPKASFSMTKKEKSIFCGVLKKVKLPQGTGSNISRCVQVNEGEISGYKSHDAHIIMQHLLPAAVRKALPKHVALPLIRLSAFFKAICIESSIQKISIAFKQKLVKLFVSLKEYFHHLFLTSWSTYRFIWSKK
ncbi:GPI mannosyltransferase 3 [Bienertia sinuspersici]